MGVTIVFNLATGEFLMYDLPPYEAVKAAYLQGERDYNTWNYPKQNVPMRHGRYCVTCGNYTALKGASKRD